jgi:fumarate reductase subunit D
VPLIAGQMTEELVWELFVQGGPIGEACRTAMRVLMLCTAVALGWKHADDVTVSQ